MLMPDEITAANSSRRLGRFELLGHLATSSNAELWVALKDGAQEPCLLRRLAADYARNELTQRRLMREAQIAFRVDHPNLARVLTAGFEGGHFCVSTDFSRGQTLAVALEQAAKSGDGSIPAPVAVRIGLALLEGLIYLHDLSDPKTGRLDLVHRDLVPSNILVGFDGAVRIIDFGTAWARLDDFRTAPGVIVGTPEYMSPEQATGESVDRRSDLYTLSVVLYEMVTGKPLITPSLNLVDVLDAIRRLTPAPPSTVNKNCPQSLDQVILRGLQKDVAERWQNATQMRSALLQVAAELTSAGPDQVGRYLRDLLPDQDQRLTALLGSARRRIAERGNREEVVTEAAVRSEPGGAGPDEVGTEIVGERRRESEAPARDEGTAIVRRRASKRPEPAIVAMGETPAVPEMPGTAAIQVPPEVLIREARRLRDRVRMWRMAFAALLACFVAATVVALSVWVRKPEEPKAARSAVLPSAEVSASAIPGRSSDGDEAAETSGELPARPPPAKPPARPRQVEKVEKPEKPAAAAEPPAPPPPADRLAELMAALASNPKDVRLFDEVVAEVTRRASALPAARRSLVRSDLDAAERTYKIEHLAEAIKKLRGG